METKFQTSFIPKQPVTESSPHRTSGASLFFLLSFVIFMASLAAAGAVFIYGTIIDTNITKGERDLNINKNAFDPNTIQQLTRLNDRINAAETLLTQHKAVSTLFQVLGNATLKTVRFNDFAYAASDDKITLTMKGQAFNYETVALQAKAFTDPSLGNVFRSPIFGDLNLDSQGNVTFSFTTGVDSFLVDYYKLKKEQYANNPAGTVSAPVSGIMPSPTDAGAANPAVAVPASGGDQGFVQVPADSGASSANAANPAANGSVTTGSAPAAGSGGTQTP